MKSFLYLICWVGIGANIYYTGFHWWTFPLFIGCLTTAKWASGLTSQDVSDYRIMFLSVTGLFLIGVLIYIFNGEDYLARAQSSLAVLPWYLNFLAAGFALALFISGSDSGTSVSRSRYQSEDDTQIPKNYLSPDDRHFQQTKDEMNRQHQEAEDMGYFK